MAHFKWIRLPSLMVVFMTGALSLLREVYGIYRGAIPPATVFWRCVWIAFILSALVVWLEEHLRIREMGKEIEALKLLPAKLTVTTYELRRAMRSNQVKGCNIWLRAKVDLIEPMHLAVDRYSMELSFDGAFDEPEFQDDASTWTVGEWSQLRITSETMRPLPMILSSGNGAEGWVHFVTDRSDYDLNHSRVRLFVHTSRGSSYAEIPAGEEYRNASRTMQIMPK